MIFTVLLAAHLAIAQGVQPPIAPLPTIVLNTNDSGAGSLRQAILNANSNNNAGTISFAIVGTAPYVITPVTSLPSLTATGFTIDGTSQPGYNNAPLVELDNEINSGAGLLVGNNTTVKGLSFITDTATNSYNLWLDNGCTVSKCYLGLRPDGVTGQASYSTTTNVVVHDNCTIGGPTSADRNLEGPAIDGILVNGNNTVVENNWLGVDVTGTKALLVNPIVNNNVIDVGVFVIAGTGNIIQNNLASGMGLGLYALNASGTVIKNNVCGPSASGVGVLSNQPQNVQTGIFAQGDGTHVFNNILVNNDTGVYVSGTNALVQDNSIGITSTGSVLGNNTGIYVDSRSTSTIKATAAGNQIISGNNFYGIFVDRAATTIMNNYFGLGAPGHGPAGNFDDIYVAADNVVITSNLFTGTVSDSVQLQNNGAFVQGNMFGVGLGGSTREGPIHGAGVRVTGIHNTISRNTFYQTLGGLIVLNSGANNNQPAPQISFAAGPQLNGTLDAAASTTYTIEFFKLHTTTANASGMTYLGQLPVTTNAGGNVSFNFSAFSGSVTDGYGATATDPLGNTSAFSSPGPASVTLSVSSIEGSKNLTGTVTLQAGTVAPMSLSVQSDSPDVSVPSTVSIAVGKNTATFPITTQTVAATETVHITAGTASATLTVQPPHLVQLLTVPATVQGGKPSTGRFVFDIPPTVAGLTATETSSDTDVATVPPTSNVSGQVGSYAISTSPVSSNKNVTMTVSFNGQTLSQTLTVTPANVAGLVISPNGLFPNQTANGNVTLSGFAGPQGNVVNLSSDNGAATVSPSVTVPSGSTSSTFPIHYSSVSTSATCTITATANGVSKTALLRLNAAVLTSVTTSGGIAGGLSAGGQVHFSANVPSNSAVALSSNNAALTVPSSVTVASGQNYNSFNFSAAAVDNPVNATITASFGGVSVTASVQIIPALLQSVTLAPTTVTSGKTSTLTVVLLGKAGSRGVTVSLSSDNGFVTVPSSATIPPGQYYVYVPVRTTAGHPGTAHISVAYNTTKQATLTVN
jgi:hypothetical protein